MRDKGNRETRKGRGKVASDGWAKEERGQYLAYVSPDYPTWKGTKDKQHMVSVVPYTVGKGNPHAPEGSLYWQRTYFVHGRIGPNSSSVICAAKCFGKPCAVCDFKNKKFPDPFLNEETKKASGKLMLQERQIVLFYDHDEKDKGIQIFDVAYKNFGEALRDKIRMARPEVRDRLGQFFDPDKGMYVLIGVKEKVTPDYKFLEYKNIEFKARKEPLPDEILDAAVCLDDLIKLPKYAEVKELIDPKTEEEEDVEEEEGDGDDEEGADEDEEGEDQDEDGGDEDSELDEEPPGVGDDVSALVNGVRKSGTVVKVKGDKAKVELTGGKTVVLSLADLRKFDKEEDEDEDDSEMEDSDLEEDEDEEPPPPPRKKPKPEVKKPTGRRKPDIDDPF